MFGTKFSSKVNLFSKAETLTCYEVPYQLMHLWLMIFVSSLTSLCLLQVCEVFPLYLLLKVL